MTDITKTPYAPWLEQVVAYIAEEKPVKIGFAALLPDGKAATSYFGGAGNFDIAAMAYHMLTDALLAVMKANAKEIVAAAMPDDEKEEEDNG